MMNTYEYTNLNASTMLFDQLDLVHQVLFLLHNTQSVCTRVRKCVHILPQARRLSFSLEASQSFPTASLHLHTTGQQTGKSMLYIMYVCHLQMHMYVCVCACVHLDFLGLQS